MSTIEEDLATVENFIDLMCPDEGEHLYGALTRIRAALADLPHLEEGAVALAEILESWSKRAPSALTPVSRACG